MFLASYVRSMTSASTDSTVQRSGPALRIGISALQFYGDMVGGAGVYVENLIRQSPTYLRDGERIVVFGTAANLMALQDYKQQELSLVELPFSDSYIRTLRLLNTIGLHWTLSAVLNRIRDLSLDVILFPQQDCLAHDLGSPLVVTFVDLQHRRLPEHFPLWRRTIRFLNDRRSLRYAAHLIAISKATRDDMVDLLGVRLDRVSVIYLGADQWNEEEAKREQRPMIEGLYLFYPATSHPHKNHVLLMNAFRLFSQSWSECKLVMTGRIMPANRRKIKKGTGKNILHLGYVSKREMDNLYRNCKGVVLPSRFEGFGLPIIEAMRFTKPILCSDLPVFREIAGDTVEYFQVDSQSDLIRKMGELLSVTDSSDLRQRYSPVVKKFSWERCAEETIALLRRLVPGTDV